MDRSAQRPLATSDAAATAEASVNAAWRVKSEPMACIDFSVDMEENKPVIVLATSSQPLSPANASGVTGGRSERSHAEHNSVDSRNLPLSGAVRFRTPVKEEDTDCTTSSTLTDFCEYDSRCRNASAKQGMSNNEAVIHCEDTRSENNVPEIEALPEANNEDSATSASRPSSILARARVRRKRRISSSSPEDNGSAEHMSKRHDSASFSKICVLESDEIDNNEQDADDDDPEFCSSCTAVTVLSESERHQISQLILSGIVSTLEDITRCIGGSCTREQAQRIVSIYFHASKFPEFDDDPGPVLRRLDSGLRLIPLVTINRVKFACERLQKKHRLATQRNAGIDKARKDLADSAASSADDDLEDFLALTTEDSRSRSASPTRNVLNRQRRLRWRPILVNHLSTELGLSVGLVCNIICHYLPEYAHLVQMPFETSLCRHCRTNGPNKIHQSISRPRSAAAACSTPSFRSRKKHGPHARTEEMIARADEYFSLLVGDDSFRSMETALPCTCRELADYLKLDYMIVYQVIKAHFPFVRFTAVNRPSTRLGAELIKRAAELLGCDAVDQRKLASRSAEADANVNDTDPYMCCSTSSSSDVSFDGADEMLSPGKRKKKRKIPQSGDVSAGQTAPAGAAVADKRYRHKSPMMLKELAQRLDISYRDVLRLRHRYFGHVKFIRYHHGRPSRADRADDPKRSVSLHAPKSTASSGNVVPYTVRHLAAAALLFNSAPTDLDELPDAYFADDGVVGTGHFAENAAVPCRDLLEQINMSVRSNGNRAENIMTVYDLAEKLSISVISTLTMYQRHFKHMPLALANGMPVPSSINVLKKALSSIQPTKAMTPLPLLTVAQRDAVTKLLCEHAFIDGQAHCQHNSPRDPACMPRCSEKHTDDAIEAVPDKFAPITAESIAQLVSVPVDAVRHALKTEFQWALTKGVACLDLGEVTVAKCVDSTNKQPKVNSNSSNLLVKVRVKKPVYLHSAASAENQLRQLIRAEYVAKQNYLVPVLGLASQFKLAPAHVLEVLNDAEFFAFWNLDACSSSRLQAIAAEMKPFIEYDKRIAGGISRVAEKPSAGVTASEVAKSTRIKKSTVHRVALLFYLGTSVADEAAKAFGATVITESMTLTNSGDVRKYRLRQHICNILRTTCKKSRLHCLLPRALAKRVGISAKDLYEMLCEPFLAEQWLVVLWKKRLFEHHSLEVERLRIAFEHSSYSSAYSNAAGSSAPVVSLTQLAERLDISVARLSMYWELFFHHSAAAITTNSITADGSSNSDEIRQAAANSGQHSGTISFKLRSAFAVFPQKKLIEALQDELLLFHQADAEAAANNKTALDDESETISVTVSTVNDYDEAERTNQTSCRSRADNSLAIVLYDKKYDATLGAGTTTAPKTAELCSEVENLVEKCCEKVAADADPTESDKRANLVAGPPKSDDAVDSTTDSVNRLNDDDIVIATVTTVAGDDCDHHAFVVEDAEKKSKPANNTKFGADIDCVDKYASWHRQMCMKYDISFLQLTRALLLIRDMNPDSNFVPAGLMPSPQSIESNKKRFSLYERPLTLPTSSSLSSCIDNLPPEPSAEYAGLVAHMRGILSTKLFMDNKYLAQRLKCGGSSDSIALVAALRKKYMPLQFSLQYAATHELLSIVRSSSPTMSDAELATLVAAAVNNVPDANVNAEAAAAAAPSNIARPTAKEERIFCKRLEARIARMRRHQNERNSDAGADGQAILSQLPADAPSEKRRNLQRKAPSAAVAPTTTTASHVAAASNITDDTGFGVPSAAAVAVRRELSLTRNNRQQRKSASSIQQQLSELNKKRPQATTAFSRNNSESVDTESSGASQLASQTCVQIRYPSLSELLRREAPAQTNAAIRPKPKHVVSAATTTVHHRPPQPQNSNVVLPNGSRLRVPVPASATAPNRVQQRPNVSSLEHSSIGLDKRGNLVCQPQQYQQIPAANPDLVSISHYRPAPSLSNVPNNNIRLQQCAGCAICNGIVPPQFLPQNMSNNPMLIASFPEPNRYPTNLPNVAQASPWPPRPPLAVPILGARFNSNSYSGGSVATSPPVTFHYQASPPPHLQLQRPTYSMAHNFVYSSVRPPPPQYVSVHSLQESSSFTPYNNAIAAHRAQSPPSQNGAFSQSAAFHPASVGAFPSASVDDAAGRSAMPSNLVENIVDAALREPPLQYRSPPPGEISRDPFLRTQLRWIHTVISKDPTVTPEQLAQSSGLPLQRITHLGLVYHRLVRMANERWNSEQQQSRSRRASSTASGNEHTVENVAHSSGHATSGGTRRNSESDEVEIIGTKTARRPRAMMPQQAMLVTSYANPMPVSLVPIIVPAPAVGGAAPDALSYMTTQQYAVLGAASSNSHSNGNWWSAPPQQNPPPVMIAPEPMPGPFVPQAALQPQNLPSHQTASAPGNNMPIAPVGDGATSSVVVMVDDNSDIGNSEVAANAAASSFPAVAPRVVNAGVDDLDDEDDGDNEVINWLLG